MRLSKPTFALHRPLRAQLLITAVLATLLVSGCSLKFPRVHKVTVQQGNVVTQEMIDKLKPGMSRSQVAYIMGEPVMRSTFEEDRWDYLYWIDVPGFFQQRITMSLYFEDDLLAYFTGDLAPNTATAEATQDAPAETQDEPADAASGG